MMEEMRDRASLIKHRQTCGNAAERQTSKITCWSLLLQPVHSVRNCMSVFFGPRIDLCVPGRDTPVHAVWQLAPKPTVCCHQGARMSIMHDKNMIINTHPIAPDNEPGRRGKVPLSVCRSSCVTRTVEASRAAKLAQSFASGKRTHKQP